MKGFGTFLGITASLLSIVSVIIRLKWAKIQHNQRVADKPPRPRWIRTAATVWLVLVGFAITVIVIGVLFKGVFELMS